MTRIQIQNSTNSKEAILADGRFESILKLAALSLKNNDFEKFAETILSDPQSIRPLAELVFDLVDKKERIDMAEFSNYVGTGKPR